MMWLGAIIHAPWQLAASHSGDWLQRTLLICASISVGEGSSLASLSREADGHNGPVGVASHRERSRRRSIQSDGDGHVGSVRILGWPLRAALAVQSMSPKEDHAQCL
jgi:hypothetical protein